MNKNFPLNKKIGLSLTRNEMMKKWYPYIILGLILILGAFLRFYRLGYQSLWYDELNTAILSRPELTISEVVTNAVNRHAQLPLSYIVRHFVMFLDSSDFIVRLPEAIYGVLAILATYIVATKMFDQSIGLLSAFLLAISYLGISYSQEARPYSLIVLLSIIAVYFFYRVIKTNERNAWIGFLIFTFLALATHMFFAVILILELVLLVVIYFSQKLRPYWKKTEVNRSTILLFFLCSIVFAIIFIPAFPYLIQNQQNYAPSNLDVAVAIGQYNPFLKLMNIYNSFSGSQYNGYLFIVFALLGTITSINSERYKTVLILIVIVLFVLLVNFAFEFVTRVPFKPRYVIAALPWFLMIVAAGIINFSHQINKFSTRKFNTMTPLWPFVLALTVVIIGTLSIGPIKNYYYETEQPDWKRAARFLEQVFQQGDIIIAYPANHFLFYYQEQNNVISPVGRSVERFQEEQLKHKRIWFVRTYLFNYRYVNQAKSIDNWINYRNKGLTFYFKNLKVRDASGIRISYISGGSTSNELFLDESVDILTEAIKIKPDGWDIHNSLGEVFLEQRNYPAAIKEFILAVQLYPDNPSLHYNLAKAYRNNSQLEKAKSHYDEAIAIEPENARAYFYRGTLLLQQGNEEEAIASFKLAHQFADTPNIIKKAPIQLSKLLIAHEEIDEAIMVIQEAVERSPDSVDIQNQAIDIYQEAADLYWARGEHSTAINLYHQAVEIAPDKAEGLAAALNEAGRFEEAIVISEWAVNLKPENLNLHLVLAQAYQSYDQLKEAINELDNAAEVGSYNANALTWHKLGNFALDLGELPIAAVFWLKAIEVNPGYPLYYVKLAEVRRKQNQPNDALSLYERALKISPEYAPAYFYRGTLLLQQGDEEEAIASFKLAHQFADTPNIIKKASIQLSKLLIAHEEIDEAIVVIQEAIERSPNSKDLQNQAIDYYQQILDKAPNNVIAHFNLALLYNATGRNRKARFQFQWVVENASRDELFEQAQQWLDKHE